MSDLSAPHECVVCRHKRLADIDALLAERVDLIKIAQRFGVTKVALRKHDVHRGTANTSRDTKVEEVRHAPGVVGVVAPGADVIELRPKKACPICTHEKRIGIEASITAGQVWSKIGRAFLVDAAAVKEHATTCVPGLRAGRNANVSAQERCLALVEQAEELIEEVRGDADASYADKAKVLSAATGLINSLGRFTGELSSTTEVVIVESPKWKRIEAAIAEALAPFPAAAAAVAKALQEMEAA